VRLNRERIYTPRAAIPIGSAKSAATHPREIVAQRGCGAVAAEEAAKAKPPQKRQPPKSRKPKQRSLELGHRQTQEDQIKDAPKPAAAKAKKQKRRPHTRPTRMIQYVARWCRNSSTSRRGNGCSSSASSSAVLSCQTADGARAARGRGKGSKPRCEWVVSGTRRSQLKATETGRGGRSHRVVDGRLYAGSAGYRGTEAYRLCMWLCM